MPIFETLEKPSEENKKKTNKKNETGFGDNYFKNYVKILLERRIDDMLNKICLELVNEI